MTVPASRFAVPWHGLHALVGLAACLVGVVNRRSLVDDARRLGAEPNVWDQVVATASDANLLVYFALPAALALGLLASERIGGDLILIRTGSQTRRLRHLLASCLRVTLPFPLALLVAAALIAVGLPLGTGWSSYALHPDGTLTPSMAGWPPPAVVGLAVLSVWGGLTVLTCAVVLIRLLASMTWALVGAAGVLVGAATAARSVGQYPALAWVQSLLPLHSPPMLGPGLWSGPVSVLAVTALLVLWCFALDQRRRGHRVSPTATWLTACAAVLALQTASRPAGTPASEIWWLAMLGVAARPPQVPDYLAFCLFFLGPLYLFVLRLDAVMGDSLPARLMRHGSTGRWATSLLGRFTLLYAAWLPLLALAAAMAAWLATGTWPTTQPGPAPWPDAGVHYFLNGILQALVSAVAIVAIRWGTARPGSGLATLGGIVAAGFLLAPMGFPVVQNSLGRLLVAGVWWPITVHLVIVLAALTLACALLLRRRAPLLNDWNFA